MRKLIAFAVLLSLTAQIHAVEWRNDYNAAAAEARAANKPLFIDFGSKGCVWCQKMEGTFQQAQGILDGFVCCKVDCDRDSQTAAAYKIHAMPTLVIVNAGWQSMKTQEGFISPQELAKFVGKAARPPSVTETRKPAPVKQPKGGGANVPKPLVDASVMIVEKYPQMTVGGSGTVIANVPCVGGIVSFVITNRHVVANGVDGKLEIVDPTTQKHFPANLLAVDDYADLSCVWVYADLPAVPLAAHLPSKGESVWQVGYPHMVGPTQRTGKFVGMDGTTRSPKGKAVNTFAFNLWSDHGDSGSGIFNAQNELCAVLWGGNGSNGSSDTYAVGIDDVWRFVDQECSIIGLRKPAGKGQSPSAQSPPSSVPPSSVPPDYQPVAQAPPVAPPDNSRIDALEAKIAAMIAAIPRGKDGLPGPQGDPGPQGPRGLDAQPIDWAPVNVRIDSLQSQLNAQAALINSIKGSIHVSVSPQ